MARPTGSMIRNYADDLRLFPTAAKRVGSSCSSRSICSSRT